MIEMIGFLEGSYSANNSIFCAFIFKFDIRHTRKVILLVEI